MSPCPAPAQVPAPPRQQTAVDVVNGVEIRDPYRWMEQGQPEFDAWAHAESRYARNMLDAIPGREALRRRIASLDQTDGGISQLQVRAGRWLYMRPQTDGGERALHVRDGLHGADRRLDLLGNLPPQEGPWSEVAAARTLSPDGRYVIFGTTRNGESEPTLRVYDLTAQQLLPDTIRWPLWADTNGFQARWLADGSGFFYVRRPDANATMDNTARARQGQLFLHLLGTSTNMDRPLFGYGMSAGIEETDTLYVRGEPHARWLEIWRRKPDGRELWVIDLATLHQSHPPLARRIWTSDVAVPGYGVLGDWLYVADARDSPRFRILRYDLRLAQPVPEVALPQVEGVISHVVAASDAIYAVESLLATSRLHVIDAQAVRNIPLASGVVSDLSPGIEGQGVWITQVDWLQPARGLLLEPGSSNPSELGGATPQVNDAAFASTMGWAVARDGERIPYSIVSRTPIATDGSAYVMLEAYGCFGSADPPFHWPSLVAWLERDGVFVHAAIRGGGELGADWHRAGRDRNKPAAFEDAIDVAKHLIRTGVTKPGRIGVSGASCGGMTMGMAALEAPHLFGAAILTVGAFDQWRLANHSAAGARSIRDIGDPTTTEGTRRILALSPYMQLLDGAARPALLIGSGATDYTIPLWVGGKFVARSRAALPRGKDVLWNIKWEAGHSTGVDWVESDTDQFAFMFWQLGHPDFQPLKIP